MSVAFQVVRFWQHINCRFWVELVLPVWKRRRPRLVARQRLEERSPSFLKVSFIVRPGALAELKRFTSGKGGP
jgi:hypothetical protein